MTAIATTNVHIDYKSQLKHWGEYYSEDAMNKVYGLVKGYRIRHGIVDNLSGLCYRIWNYVKSFFGKSDWQKAKNILCDERRPQNLKSHELTKKDLMERVKQNEPENIEKWKKIITLLKEMANYGSPEAAIWYLEAVVESINVEGLKK